MRLAQASRKLARPLNHPPLRSILRNPYFLDKALDIPWLPERPLPENEREFRLYFWQHLVRTEGAPGLGRRREQVLEEIAIRRARALSEYIPLADLDPAVVASLKTDSLIICPDGESSLIATAHHVLEDWAILEWFEEQHLAEAASFAQLAAAIGTHPAYSPLVSRKHQLQQYEHMAAFAAKTKSGRPIAGNLDAIEFLQRFGRRFGGETLILNDKDGGLRGAGLYVFDSAEQCPSVSF